MGEKEQTTIRLPSELKKDVEKEADKRNISFNEMVNMCLYAQIELIRRME